MGTMMLLKSRKNLLQSNGVNVQLITNLIFFAATIAICALVLINPAFAVGAAKNSVKSFAQDIIMNVVAFVAQIMGLFLTASGIVAYFMARSSDNGEQEKGAIMRAAIGLFMVFTPAFINAINLFNKVPVS